MRTRAVPREPWKTIAKVSLVVYSIAFLSFVNLIWYYLHHSEFVVDTKTGAIYPLNYHGWIFYINQARHHLLEQLKIVQGISGGIFVAAGIVNIAVKPRNERNSLNRE